MIIASHGIKNLFFYSFRRGTYNDGGSMSRQPEQEVEQSYCTQQICTIATHQLNIKTHSKPGDDA